ncbi:sulfatase-like hydrolase/transferase [Tunicatimonas pelagia]|uniref:sulfatase-like hydrolase/transferase n=1 Tax=Tunicatimonas pelagia TaxID=931531 RepID=UPI0026651BAC|nr:sulfatase-like hydrolase/transferase [Tunicatimonas pelagia]WKN43751.1 sulfatase-like hydrolase/transferase [Tunicatimonas pelagia]
MKLAGCVYLLFILLSTNGQITAQDQESRPNILFIVTDDQQVGLLGIEGNLTAQTPHIDRIGQEGVIFKNAFVTTPLCSPSRASFLTGNYAHRHYVVNNDKLGLEVVSHTLLTWPRQLREAGYTTAFIGKWHMGLDDSRRPGYDRWFSFKGQGDYIDGVVNDEGTRTQTTGYMTGIINEQALSFLQNSPSEKPFAMIIAHKAVHWLLLPAERHEEMYSNFVFDSVAVTKEDTAGKPLLRRLVPRKKFYEYENVLPEPPESRRGRGRERSAVVGDQHRSLKSVDEGVGELFKALEEANQLDNTIIVYVSDNGMLMGEHGEFNMKRWAYDPVLRIPMLIRYPPLVTAGSVREQLVLNIDIAPTLLQLAGVTPLEPMDGETMVPLLKDSLAPGRNALLAEYFLEKVAPRVRPWQAVRTKRWKYIQYTESGIPAELYDLKNDPGEIINLVEEGRAQVTIDSLQQLMKGFL